MDKKEAIFRIKDHMEHHGIGKYPHLKLKEALDMAIAALDTPNAEKPPCYLPEKDNPYPLCEGRGMKACAHCCLWEDYDPEEDEGRVNQPLTMRQLREMDGEPVYIVIDGVDPLKMWVLVEIDGADIYLTNNLGGRSSYKEARQLYKFKLYRHPPEGET